MRVVTVIRRISKTFQITPVLLAWPYFASRRRDGLIQFAMGIVYPLTGIMVWVESFLLSDMMLMCRLF